MTPTDQAAFVARMPEIKATLRKAETLGCIEQFGADMLTALCVIEAQQAKLDAQASEIADLKRELYLHHQIIEGQEWVGMRVQLNAQDEQLAALRRAMDEGRCK